MLATATLIVALPVCSDARKLFTICLYRGEKARGKRAGSQWQQSQFQPLPLTCQQPQYLYQLAPGQKWKDLSTQQRASKLRASASFSTPVSAWSLHHPAILKLPSFQEFNSAHSSNECPYKHGHKVLWREEVERHAFDRHGGWPEGGKPKGGHSTDSCRGRRGSGRRLHAESDVRRSRHVLQRSAAAQLHSQSCKATRPLSLSTAHLPFQMPVLLKCHLFCRGKFRLAILFEIVCSCLCCVGLP